MIVQDIMDKVSTLYNDTDYVRVSKAMYLKFLDDALTQLVAVRPDAHYKEASVQLSAGTKQSVPADCLVLLDVIRNKGAAGTTDGAPVWQIKKKDVDYFSNWHAAAAVAPTAITEFAFDPKFPNTYWVSPPPAAGSLFYIELAYSYPFTKLASAVWATALATTIDTAETFLNPICDYILYSLYSLDTSSKNDKLIADSYLKSFYNSLGIDTQVGDKNAPEVGEENDDKRGGK